MGPAIVCVAAFYNTATSRRQGEKRAAVSLRGRRGRENGGRVGACVCACACIDLTLFHAPHTHTHHTHKRTHTHAQNPHPLPRQILFVGLYSFTGLGTMEGGAGDGTNKPDSGHGYSAERAELHHIQLRRPHVWCSSACSCHCATETITGFEHD